MNTLQRHFDDCRLPVEFVSERPTPRRERIAPLMLNTATPAPSADDFCYVDVAKENRAEHFRVYVHPDAELYLRDKRPSTRHMLLQMRCFPNGDETAQVRNFLLGHDERQLFVVPNRRSESVEKAIQALKPWQARWSERRGQKVVRQGDWFFVPVPHWFRVPVNGVPANGEMIGGVNARSRGITVGNPHIAEEQIIVAPLIQPYPSRPDVTYVARAGLIIVRGKIRHSEHSTIDLQGWHEPIQNTSVSGVTLASIGYRD